MYLRDLTPNRRRLVELARIHGLPSIYPMGKVYDHMIICSGDRRKPIGHSGCICLRALRTPVKSKDEAY